MSYVTTLVVDDQPVVRFALRVLLEDSDEGVRVTEAGSGREALLKFANSRPALVITELALSDGSSAGAAICRFVKNKFDAISVLVFTADASPAAVASALNAGADSFVHKSAPAQELLEAIRRTRAGKRAWIVGAGSSMTPAVPRVPTTETGLTAREQEVLTLVLVRCSNDEIADALHLATQTVKNHVSSVLHKLGFTSRRELFRSLDLRPCLDALPAGTASTGQDR